jgi:hypothetical protein
MGDMYQREYSECSIKELHKEIVEEVLDISKGLVLTTFENDYKEFRKWMYALRCVCEAHDIRQEQEILRHEN